MMKLSWILFCILIPLAFYAQPHPSSPVMIYGDLFRDVQLSGIFPSGRAFANAVAKRIPADIALAYSQLKSGYNKKLPRRMRGNALPADVLKTFVDANFMLPGPVNDSLFLTTDTAQALEIAANVHWKKLRFQTDSSHSVSSLIHLPYPYIACGPSFNELHYWDAYFILLGLKESGQYEMMENMINNFTYLIDKYGHIPATNRTYCIGRSEPPFFCYMIDLLASVKGNNIYHTYLPWLEKEYLFWMEGADSIKPGSAYKRVVKFNDGTVMNRYWGQSEPRPEYYAEDRLLAENSNRPAKETLTELAAASESGWGASSRWLEKKSDEGKLNPTHILPVDLNSLLHHLECILRDIYKSKEDHQKVLYYADRILNREVKLDFLFWDEELSFYCDYNYRLKKTTGQITAAGMFPLLIENRYRAFPENRVQLIVETLRQQLLFDGGICNSVLQNEAQWWQAPYGTASMQWVVITALENHRYHELAKKIALGWVNLSWEVYLKTGWLLKHYNVMNAANYYDNAVKPNIDNFACNNGLLLNLINNYRMRNDSKAKQ
jgi:alpha,alpha-trehalase